MTGVVDSTSNRVGRDIFRPRTSVRALPAVPSEHHDLTVPGTERGDCFAGRGCDFFRGEQHKIKKMLPGMRRGPKPTRWRDDARAGFAAFFARRSQPVNSPPDDDPLTEASSAGHKWLFSEFGKEPTQVQIEEGGAVRNTVLGVTGSLLMLG